MIGGDLLPLMALYSQPIPESLIAPGLHVSVPPSSSMKPNQNYQCHFFTYFALARY